MKIEIEVTHHFDRRGLVVVIPRAALLAWIEEAFKAPIPEVVKPDGVKPLPTMTVADLHLSRRTRRCLDQAGITTVTELTRRFESDLLKMEGLGKVCLHEIKAALKKDGLRLGMR